MKCLALDTATEACSVALLVDGQIRSADQIALQQHTSLILPMIEALLAEAEISLQQLDALAFGRGPGSFTGLRIAAAITQALAFAHDLPVLPISTLQTLAQQAFRKRQAEYIFAALDARMGEIYWGIYQYHLEGIHLLGGEQLSAPDQISLPVPLLTCCGIGSGWDRFSATLISHCQLSVSLERACYPLALDMLPLAEQAFSRGEGVSAEQAQPVYLRNRIVRRQEA